MRALITGVTGQLGSFLLRDLLAHHHEIAILIRNPAKAYYIADLLDHCHVLVGDFENLIEQRQAILAWKPDTCFHIGWFGVTAEFRDDPRQVSTNAIASVMLLEILAQAGCRSFIGIGSQAEYGVANEILREDLPLHPVNAYGCTKAAVSMLSEKFCSLVGMRWVWLRLIATYGPADDNKHLIPYIINQLLGCKKPSLSAGKQMWDYLYVDDASKAIRICGENTSISGVMNLASGNVRSIREIAENIRDLINPSLQIGFGEIPYPTNAIMHLQADISKIRNTTGWEPTTSWEQGLAKTIAWFRSR